MLRLVTFVYLASARLREFATRFFQRWVANSVPSRDRLSVLCASAYFQDRLNSGSGYSLPGYWAVAVKNVSSCSGFWSAFPTTKDTKVSRALELRELLD